MIVAPFALGAAHVTSMFPNLSATALTCVGALGSMRGVTASDGSEYFPVPAAFTAATIKV